MAAIYADTSALMKLFLDETGSTLVRAVFDEAEVQGTPIYTSAWSLNELLAGLLKRHNRGEITEGEMHTFGFNILRIAGDLAAAGVLGLIEIDGTVRSQALAYVFGRRLFSGDALHLATAKLGPCDAILTADKHLLRAGPAEGLPAFNAEDNAVQERLLALLRS